MFCAYLKCRDVACRISPGGNSLNYHIHLMRCAARQPGGEQTLEHLLQILFIQYINSKKLEEKSVPRREIAISRRGMAVSRRGIAISRRGMQKYTIFSWFCSCYLVLTFKRSSTECHQEYYRKAAIFIAKQTTSHPLLKNPHNSFVSKSRGANKNHTKTKLEYHIHNNTKKMPRRWPRHLILLLLTFFFRQAEKKECLLYISP